MKRILMYLLYALSSLLNDIAFYVLGDEVEEIGIEIETHWSIHNY